MSTRALALLVALGCLWGASFLFVKVVVDEIPPLELTAGRLLSGAVVLIPLAIYRRVRLPSRPSMIAKIAVMAALSTVAPFTLIAWAEVHIETGVASVLNATTPIFTALFAMALAEERFTPARAAGLAMALAGVAVLAGRDVLDIAGSSLLAQLAVVGAAACYGAGAVYTRTVLRSEDPLPVAALQLTIGAGIAFALTVAANGTPDYGLDAKGWLSLLTLGALGTGIAYVVYLWLIDNLGSVRASLVTYVIPVVGLLLGWAVLDESIGVNTAVGAALIIGGVASVLRGQAPSTQRAAPAAISTAD